LTCKINFLTLWYNYKDMKTHVQNIVGFMIDVICQKWFQRPIFSSGIFM
jgi:hypothetical protein